MKSNYGSSFQVQMTKDKQIKNQNKLQIERENQDNLNQRIDSCLEMLKEIEHVESNMINPTFAYYKQNQIDQKLEENEVVLEHRSGI